MSDTQHQLMIQARVQDAGFTSGMRKLGQEGANAGQMIARGAQQASTGFQGVAKVGRPSLETVKFGATQAVTGLLMMGDAAQSTAGRIGMLASQGINAFATGGIIGVGLAAATGLIGLLGAETTKAADEARKAREEYSSWLEDSRQRVQKLRDEIEELHVRRRARATGGDEAAAVEGLGFDRQGQEIERKRDERIAKLKAERDRLYAEAGDAFFGDLDTGGVNTKNAQMIEQARLAEEELAELERKRAESQLDRVEAQQAAQDDLYEKHVLRIKLLETEDARERAILLIQQERKRLVEEATKVEGRDRAVAKGDEFYGAAVAAFDREAAARAEEAKKREEERLATLGQSVLLRERGARLTEEERPWLAQLFEIDRMRQDAIKAAAEGRDEEATRLSSLADRLQAVLGIEQTRVKVAKERTAAEKEAKEYEAATKKREELAEETSYLIQRARARSDEARQAVEEQRQFNQLIERGHTVEEAHNVILAQREEREHTIVEQREEYLGGLNQSLLVLKAENEQAALRIVREHELNQARKEGGEEAVRLLQEMHRLEDAQRAKEAAAAETAGMTPGQAARHREGRGASARQQRLQDMHDEKDARQERQRSGFSLQDSGFLASGRSRGGARHSRLGDMAHDVSTAGIEEPLQQSGQALGGIGGDAASTKAAAVGMSAAAQAAQTEAKGMADSMVQAGADFDAMKSSMAAVATGVADAVGRAAQVVAKVNEVEREVKRLADALDLKSKF